MVSFRVLIGSQLDELHPAEKKGLFYPIQVLYLYRAFGCTPNTLPKSPTKKEKGRKTTKMGWLNSSNQSLVAGQTCDGNSDAVILQTLEINEH